MNAVQGLTCDRGYVAASSVVSSRGPSVAAREHEKKILESILPPDLRHLIGGGLSSMSSIQVSPIPCVISYTNQCQKWCALVVLFGIFLFVPVFELIPPQTLHCGGISYPNQCNVHQCQNWWALVVMLGIFLFVPVLELILLSPVLSLVPRVQNLILRKTFSKSI